MKTFTLGEIADMADHLGDVCGFDDVAETLGAVVKTKAKKKKVKNFLDVLKNKLKPSKEFLSVLKKADGWLRKNGGTVIRFAASTITTIYPPAAAVVNPIAKALAAGLDKKDAKKSLLSTAIESIGKSKAAQGALLSIVKGTVQKVKADKAAGKPTAKEILVEGSAVEKVAAGGEATIKTPVPDPRTPPGQKPVRKTTARRPGGERWCPLSYGLSETAPVVGPAAPTVVEETDEAKTLRGKLKALLEVFTNAFTALRKKLNTAAFGMQDLEKKLGEKNLAVSRLWRVTLALRNRWNRIATDHQKDVDTIAKAAGANVQLDYKPLVNGLDPESGEYSGDPDPENTGRLADVGVVPALAVGSVLVIAALSIGVMTWFSGQVLKQRNETKDLEARTKALQDLIDRLMSGGMSADAAARRAKELFPDILPDKAPASTPTTFFAGMGAAVPVIVAGAVAFLVLSRGRGGKA